MAGTPPAPSPLPRHPSSFSKLVPVPLTLWACDEPLSPDAAVPPQVEHGGSTKNRLERWKSRRSFESPRDAAVHAAKYLCGITDYNLKAGWIDDNSDLSAETLDHFDQLGDNEDVIEQLAEGGASCPGEGSAEGSASGESEEED